jgi:eukaryotic-like serine/threonine-protein kinase
MSEVGPSLVGRTLAERYRVESEIARGGMAGVYRARDLRLDRDVAVKVLAEPYASDADFTARFLGEARAAASMSHPSLVHVYDSGSDGDAHYIVMELLERHRTLRQRLDAEGRLPVDEVLRIGRDLLAGLAVVHERGLVHCDVKPANVMIGPGGGVKLIDFGIATQPHGGTDGDTSIGSLRFMAPEQLRGEALTPASDLFSVGAVLYEALTGRPPYSGETPEEISAAHAEGRVRPPSTLVAGVPGRLDEALLQALRRDPGARFDRADAMEASLDASVDEMARSPDDDTTRVVSIPPPPTPSHDRGAAGYVPPAAPEPTPMTAPGDVRRRAPPPPPAGRGGGLWGLIGTMVVLAAAALVVVLIVLPLVNLGLQGGGSSSTPTPVPTVEPGSNTVAVPDLVGMPTAEALGAARESGLDWTLYCDENPDRPEGIIDQEPSAGTQVEPGSTFSLYSARFADCE